LPRWADVSLVPLISLLLAAIISALVLLSIGQSPVEAFNVMVDGALGSAYGWGYTLYYTTSFIFTGLAVTVAFHAGLFNIGGEGQAQLGALGVALVSPVCRAPMMGGLRGLDGTGEGEYFGGHPRHRAVGAAVDPLHVGLAPRAWANHRHDMMPDSPGPPSKR